MRRLLRPRNWIALLAGIGAGLFVWMLPPLPNWRVAPSEGSVLHALSPAGRHVVTWRLDEGQNKRIIEVWDRSATDREPITFTIPQASSWQARFAPDGKTLVFAEGSGDAMREVKWLDLASGNLVKSRRLAAEEVFFSTDGTLLYFKDKSLHRVEDGAEVCRLPETIDGFTHNPARHLRYRELVAYAKDDSFQSEQCEILVYDALLRKEVGRMTIPGNMTYVRALSRDGKVVSAYGWAPGSTPWRTADLHVMADAAGVTRASRDLPGHYFRSLSPNGESVASYQPTERPEWLKKWLPLKDNDTTFVIADWRTGIEQARFRDIVHLEFSPDNEHLVVMRSGNIVEGYAWPLRTSWGLLVTAMLVTAGAVWMIGWSWACWRERRHGLRGVA